MASTAATAKAAASATTVAKWAFKQIPSTTQLTNAAKVFGQECRFVTSSSTGTDLPQLGLPEVVVVGRSNVGKSSLLNALMNSRRLVKMSKRPGHTKLLNLFTVGNNLSLVDCPGYGHQSREPFMEAMGDYLTSREMLCRTFVLVNTQHGLKDIDRAMLDMLNENQILHQIILTKCDKLNPENVRKQVVAIEKFVQHEASLCVPQVIKTSAKSRTGIENLRYFIAEACDAL